MPIKVKCQCGQGFSANDKLAGKTVKCPKCANPIKIPNPQAPVTSVAQLLEEAGLGYIGEGRQCPECGSQMSDEAVICVECGYNEKLGRRMKTRMLVGDLDGKEERESLGHEMLDHAVLTMEKDKQQEIEMTKGLPWWVYLLVLIGIVILMISMAFMPQDKVMVASVWVIMGALSLASMYCGIRLWIIAFQESTMHGLLWLVPFYSLYYVITRWERCSFYFLWYVGINIVIGCVRLFLLPLVMGD